jgi:hypothetical protein
MHQNQAVSGLTRDVLDQDVAAVMRALTGDSSFSGVATAAFADGRVVETKEGQLFSIPP